MESEVQILRAIQTASNPVLDFIAEVLTTLGGQYFITGILLVIYWCVNKKMGKWLLFSCIVTSALSNGIKAVFKAERPIGKEGIRSISVESATGYSFPSCHSSQASNFTFSIYFWIKKRWVLILAIMVSILIGVCRLYQGVHWPKDVIGGILIGAFSSFLLYKIYTRFEDKLWLLIFIFAAIMSPLLFIEGDVSDFWKIFSILIWSSPAFYLEEKYVGFSTKDIKAKHFAYRILTGTIIVSTIFLGLKLILPEGNLFLFIRYGLLGFSAVFISPLAFKKLKI